MKLLYVDACVRDDSRTKKLSEHFISELAGRYEVKHIKLNDLRLTPLLHDELIVRDALLAAEDYQNDQFLFAREFVAADRIVFAAPYWDMSFPAALKIYFERVSAANITFGGEGDKLIGLCKAEKALYISTAGGHVEYHHGEAYTKALLEMLGVYGFEGVCCDGLDVQGADIEKRLSDTKKKLSAAAMSF